MMLKSIVFSSGSVPVLVDATDIHGTREPRFGSVVCCSSRNSAYNVPKLEPFSRTKFERAVKDLPLIEKSENDLAGTLLILVLLQVMRLIFAVLFRNDNQF